MAIIKTKIVDVAGVNIAHVSVDGALKVDVGAITVTPSGTQTITGSITGTVTANAGTNLNTSALALDATLTGGTQKTKLVDSGGTNLASISSGGALKVDGSAATQPVSGTFWQATQPVSGTVAATQSGTWTVQPGNTANTTAWKVDGSAVTQPVSGTITVNAGTNLNTSALALDTSINGILLSQASTTSGQKGTLSLGAVTTNAPSYTTAQTDPISLDTSGLLRVSIKDTPQNTTAFKVDGSAVTQPVSGTFWQATQPVSGTVTANAGTNLNTSLLALDTSVNGILVAQASTTAGQTGPLVQSATTTNSPSYTTAKTNPLSTDTLGNLRVSLKDTPANTNKLLVTADAITFASPQHVINDASSAVIGHVITDSGSVTNATLSAETTKVIGTVNQGTSPWVTSGVITTGSAQIGHLEANQSVNVAQINGITPLMGNGITGTGSQRVTIASDNTAFSVNATLSAETTKVIGTVNQGTSPWVVSGTVTANAGTNLNTSALNLEATQVKLTLAQASTTSGQSGPLIQGAVTTNAPSYVTAQTDPLSLDTSGLLRVSLKDTPANTNKFLVTADPITFASPQHVINDAGSAVIGHVIVDSGSIGVTNLPTTADTNYGTVGASTIRTASEIGNATGAALFGAGTTTAQVLRVVLPTDQTVIPVQGQKTNNNAAPGATNIGTLPALANAAAPSWSEGNQVALSTDLAGNARVIDIADGPVAPGTAATKSTLIGGQFNTTLPTLTNTQQAAAQMDASGRLIVANTPLQGTSKTYSAAGLVTSAASATDIFAITGSASKTVVVTQMLISGIATTATVSTVNILKRSTANSVGTPTTITNVPSDSLNAAATATVVSYAGVPTTGTLVGNIRTIKLYTPPASGGQANTPSAPIIMAQTFSQSITLRGTGEVVAFNLGGVTVTGGVFAVSIEWIEF